MKIYLINKIFNNNHNNFNKISFNLTNNKIKHKINFK